MESPYKNVPVNQWEQTTKALVNKHPISKDKIVSAVLESWKQIQGSKIADSIIIGETYFPTPQILGDFLHELIPIQLSKYDVNWRKGEGNSEKDVVIANDDFYSFEIKTSSQKNIYGNRSYAQKGARSAKDKSGYYLAINFPPVHKNKRWEPISMIRFGWIDAEDWTGQASATGQQASLSKEVLEYKLIKLYPQA